MTCQDTDDGDLVAGDLVANSFMGLIPGKPAIPPFHDDPLRNLVGLRGMPVLNPTRLHVGHGAPLETERVRRWADREPGRLTRLEAAGRIATRADDSADEAKLHAFAPEGKGEGGVVQARSAVRRAARTATRGEPPRQPAEWFSHRPRREGAALCLRFLCVVA